jgi:hypothetical protein
MFSPLRPTQAEIPLQPFSGSEAVKPPDGADGCCRKSRASRGVADTSAEAFHSLPVADYLQPKERAILALFTGPQVKLSRQQISAVLPMPINCVCGRVDSLLSAGHLVEQGDRIDPATRKRQKLLQLPARDLLGVASA